MLKQNVKSIGDVPTTPDMVLYVLFSWAIQQLEGQILTVIDASIADPVQRKAVKDILRPMIWKWAIESNSSSQYEIKQKLIDQK